MGLAPGSGVAVALDSQWDDNSAGYLSSCRCGHTVADHATAEDVPREEYRRRGRVAIRLDEILGVSLFFWRVIWLWLNLLPGQGPAS